MTDCVHVTVRARARLCVDQFARNNCVTLLGQGSVRIGTAS